MLGFGYQEKDFGLRAVGADIQALQHFLGVFTEVFLAGVQERIDEFQYFILLEVGAFHELL